MDFVGNARHQLAMTTKAPLAWKGTSVGEMPPAQMVAEYTIVATTDRERANTINADLVRLSQAGDQLAPVMLVALIGPYLRRRCRVYGVDEVISEFIEEIYRWPIDRCEARASKFAERVTQRLRRQRERTERIEADVAMLPPIPPANTDEFVELLNQSTLPDADKRLLFESRVLDQGLEVLAAQRGVGKSTIHRNIAAVERELIEELRAAA